MGEAKQITVKIIPHKIAAEFVKKTHYSGKSVINSVLHFGVFYKNNLHGVMQFGSPTDKRKCIGFVKGTLWTEFLELNRMAFDNVLPRNSESRAISIAILLIKKHAPHIKWILSYSDATQCGDGTIYRASGFVLTQINVNKSIWLMPDGKKEAKINFEPGNPAYGAKKRYGKTEDTIYWSWSAERFLKHIGATPLKGFMMRYIYLVDKTCELTVPIIPFEEIKKQKASMYLGNKVNL
jgi:hypothetical protein